MSTYLNLYYKTRERNGKPSEFIQIMSLSSSHPLTRPFWDYGVESAYAYNKDSGEIEDTRKYTRITSEMLESIMDDYNSAIERTKNQINAMYRLRGNDIEESAIKIASQEEYLNEQINEKNMIDMISLMQEQCEYEWNDVEGIYGNIG